MLGLDGWLAGFSDGTTLLVVGLVAVVLGLRHATDPDHLAAVATLIAGTEERATRAAARLGLAWGAGHAASLFAFGVPIVLFKTYLPDGVERGAETAVGLLIVALAIWLLARWRRGLFHVHVHAHEQERMHAHGHVHDGARHPHGTARARRPAQAFAIGLVHGIGGSAGVGVLLLASIHDHLLAVAALAIFAACTALSMALLSTGLGRALSSARLRASFDRLAPGLALLSLAFGTWYALGALDLAPYFF
jgi:ABC-type nickel/cobalt efflux system permease component RcnA